LPHDHSARIFHDLLHPTLSLAKESAVPNKVSGRFIWHELMTTDVSAARAFYEKVIGWSSTKFDSPNDYWVWMAGQTPVAGLMAVPDGMGEPPSWIAYVEVPDVDETMAQAPTLGGSVMKEAHTMPGVGRFGFLRDPQGAMFAVITSETKVSPETDPKLLEFSWHELHTTDWKAARDFYSALFGWETKDETDMGPMGIYYQFGHDRFTYGGMFSPPPMPGSKGPHWLHYTLVDSADSATKRATDAGGTVATGPMDVPGGDRVSMLIDPMGTLFAVHAKGSK
jgi:predicted enzyme related to lactoylglutathione lyase